MYLTEIIIFDIMMFRGILQKPLTHIPHEDRRQYAGNANNISLTASIAQLG